MKPEAYSVKPEVHLTNRFYLGQVLVEPPRHLISYQGGTNRVTKRDMDVLMCLVEKGTRVVTREEIMDSVWKDDVVNEEVLTLAISRLRAALSDNPKSPQIIETIPKRGYRLMVPAQSATGAHLNGKTKKKPKVRNSCFSGTSVDYVDALCNGED